MRPILWRADLRGYPKTTPYVLRYWTPVVGPGAVADLLRLRAAARRGQSLREPLHLAELARVGLVRFAGGRIWVHDTGPPLSAAHLRRLPPALRAEHRLERWQISPRTLCNRIFQML